MQQLSTQNILNCCIDTYSSANWLKLYFRPYKSYFCIWIVELLSEYQFRTFLFIIYNHHRYDTDRKYNWSGLKLRFIFLPGQYGHAPWLGTKGFTHCVAGHSTSLQYTYFPLVMQYLSPFSAGLLSPTAYFIHFPYFSFPKWIEQIKTFFLMK